MASKKAALSIVGLFVVFLVVLVVVQFLKPYRREGFFVVPTKPTPPKPAPTAAQLATQAKMKAAKTRV